MRVFICYSRADLAFAEQLIADLSRYNLDVWIDLRSIPHGANWDLEVQKGLDSSDLMLVLLSPEAVSSQNVADEWSYFIEKDKPIVPLMLRLCEVPFRLMRRQRVDFIRDYQAGFEDLLRAIGSPEITDPESTQKIARGSLRPSVRDNKLAKPDNNPTLQISETTGIRTYPMIWATAYRWFSGMQGGIEGDLVINTRELMLISRDQPIISIPLQNLISVKTQRSIDPYLKLMFYTSDGSTQSLSIMGAPRNRRQPINAEIINVLRSITGRTLD